MSSGDDIVVGNAHETFTYNLPIQDDQGLARTSHVADSTQATVAGSRHRSRRPSRKRDEPTTSAPAVRAPFGEPTIGLSREPLHGGSERRRSECVVTLARRVDHLDAAARALGRTSAGLTLEDDDNRLGQPPAAVASRTPWTNVRAAPARDRATNPWAGNQPRWRRRSAASRTSSRRQPSGSRAVTSPRSARRPGSRAVPARGRDRRWWTCC